MTNGEYLAQLGKKIRIARRSKKLTLDEVSKECGINLNTLCYIEKGQQNAHILMLKGIADAMDMNVKDFL